MHATGVERKLRVLISAYACEPGKGSEPEVGWQWALQMARFHEVVVVTRANNRPVIEAELERLRGQQPLPTFVYHDCDPLVLGFKQRFTAVRGYYLVWQRSVRDVIAQLHQIYRFDLFHHVTFASFRYPAGIWGHGAASLWGPVGGIETVRWGLLPWHHPRSLWAEAVRGLNNWIQAASSQVLGKRAAVTTQILASTREMQETFRQLGCNCRLMPTVGLKTHDLPYRPHGVGTGPLRLLFVGNLITLKGVDLAIDALKVSGATATLTFVGAGNYEAAARRQVRRRGLAGQVRFAGRLPRSEVLKIYPDYDVFFFPSLHDTGGFALIEAMFNGLPAICLDCGGPAVAVQDGCGLKVPLGSRNAVVNGLATALRRYDGDRRLVADHGDAARQVILREYDWDTKGREMNAVYHDTVKRAAAQSSQPGGGGEGLGALTRTLHRTFAWRGALSTALALLLVAVLGFVSVGHLKREAQQILTTDLPSLRQVNVINAGMEAGFKGALLYLLSETPEQRQELRAKIEQGNLGTESNLATFSRLLVGSAERQQFAEMIQRRQEYVAVRNRIMTLVDDHRPVEAFALSQSALVPTFQKYSRLVEQLLDRQLHDLQTRSEQMVALCTLTQVVAAVVAVVLFTLEFVFGFLK